MNWLRSIVSGKSNRYKDDNYDLDVTYITDRILAMAFPASGLETCYRNSLDNVAKFLDERHHGKYRVFNLSNRAYDDDKFKGVTNNYIWKDHYPPTIYILFKVWYDMYEFLMTPDTVCVVHCNAGKGRTGTAISWFLLYSGLSKTTEDAIRYYGRK